MKTNRKNRMKGNGQTSQSLRVEFTQSTAKAVTIAGAYKDSRAGSLPMMAPGHGRCLKDLVPPPGRYEYWIVADGKRMSDPSAKATAPNPFGGVNCLLMVPSR